jgi:hypothetical protein
MCRCDHVGVCRLQCILYTKGVPVCTTFPHRPVFTVPSLIITRYIWQWVLEVVVSHKRQTSETTCSRTWLHCSGGWLVHRAHFGNSLPLSISVGVQLPADCQPVVLCISFIHRIGVCPRGPCRESRKLAVVFRTSTVHKQTNESRHMRYRFLN